MFICLFFCFHCLFYFIIFIHRAKENMDWVGSCSKGLNFSRQRKVYLQIWTLNLDYLIYLLLFIINDSNFIIFFAIHFCGLSIGIDFWLNWMKWLHFLNVFAGTVNICLANVSSSFFGGSIIMDLEKKSKNKTKQKTHQPNVLDEYIFIFNC